MQIVVALCREFVLFGDDPSKAALGQSRKRLTLTLSQVLVTYIENGTMDDRLWKGYDVSYRATFCIDSARQIWDEIQRFFGDDFRAHVNSTTEEECGQTSF